MKSDNVNEIINSTSDNDEVTNTNNEKKRDENNELQSKDKVKKKI